VGHAGTQESRHGALHQGARHRDLPDGQQLVEVKLKPDAEHQQDCAHFRQLLGKMLVGHETGRVEPDQQSGDEIADDRRQSDPVGEISADDRDTEGTRSVRMRSIECID
jgi:hypothetical protein